MSLDVALQNPTGSQERWAIFIREDGQTKEITLEEWNNRFPGKEPTLCHVGGDEEVFEYNITHNLGKMASAAGIYKHLWRPEELDINTAEQLIEPLKTGLQELKNKPDIYKQYNPPNGWGRYEGLVTFVEKYLEACKAYPKSKIWVWR